MVLSVNVANADASDLYFRIMADQKCEISVSPVFFQHFQKLVDNAEAIDIDTVIKAYGLGDPYFNTQIDLGIRLLSVSVANTLIIQDIDKIYLNSRLFRHDSFQNQLTALIQEQLNFIPTKRNIEIEITQFDDYRGAIGACALASFAFLIKNKHFDI